MRTKSNINRSFSVISINKHSNIYTITSGLSFSKKKKVYLWLAKSTLFLSKQPLNCTMPLKRSHLIGFKICDDQVVVNPVKTFGSPN